MNLKSSVADFNSSMVRLKDDVQVDRFDQILYFNSSMVRLKGRFFCAYTYYIYRFQFQYGTIKSSLSVRSLPFCT